MVAVTASRSPGHPMRGIVQIWALVALGACGPAEPVQQLAEAQPGSALRGLSAVERGAFAAGQALFNRPFTVGDGLGPLFNQDRCSSCHDLPASGGHGAEPVLKATRLDPLTGCSTLPEEGGDLIQRVVTEPARAAGLTGEMVPAGATHAVEILAPAVFGLGLVAAIPESVIVARADPDDLDGDGISGRTGGAGDRVGRFGHRAQHVTLEEFVDEAIHLEMGITTPDRPVDVGRNGSPLPAGVDPAADPEVDERTIRLLVDYLRFLAPPAQRLPSAREDIADVQEGERIFQYLGCAACHVPVFETGDGQELPPAIRGKRFRLYSDLLLHDMGPDLADICSPGMMSSEWKTSRLVGLGYRSEFLHNGMAQNLSAAIELHGGEASDSRDLFRRLTPEARRQLLAFLHSL